MLVKDLTKVFSRSYVFIKYYANNRFYIEGNWQRYALNEVDRVEIDTTYIKNGTPCFMVYIKEIKR